jgi:hypothetical protein
MPMVHFRALDRETRWALQFSNNSRLDAWGRCIPQANQSSEEEKSEGKEGIWLFSWLENTARVGRYYEVIMWKLWLLAKGFFVINCECGPTQEQKEVGRYAIVGQVLPLKKCSYFNKGSTR